MDKEIKELYKKLKDKKIIIKSFMKIEEKDVKVKISYCPECGGACRIAIEHAMTKQSKKDFMKEVFKYNLDVKTIPLNEYRTGNESLGCKKNCSLQT